MRKYLLWLLLLCSGWVYAQDRTVLNVANDDDYATFSFFDSLPLENYNLFFTGEDHRYPYSNSDIELKMFKYLHKTQGVRVFALEFGEGMSHFINKYISEDDSIAEKVLKRNLQKAYFRLFTRLKEFYESLPKDEKFEVKGVDIEREPMYAAKYLDILTPKVKRQAHDSIKIHIEAFKAIAEYFESSRRWGKYFVNNEFDESEIYINKEYISPFLGLSKAVANFKQHKEKYAVYLQENYEEFSKAIEWLNTYFYWRSLNSTPQMYLLREGYMEDNIAALFTANPSIKVYGQFGRCHTATNREKKECNYYYFNSLATRLNNSEHKQLKNKVFSCPIFYPYSYSFRTETKIDDGLKDLAKKTEKNKIMVFKLDSSAYPNQKNLAKRFNAIIINNLQKDKAADGVAFEGTTSYSFNPHIWNERLLLLAEGGIKGYNFKQTNKAFGTNFNNQQQFIGFSIGYAENYGLNVNTAVHWFPSTKSIISDSVSASLRGFAASMRYSKDVIKKDEIDLTLGIGYGFERWTNTITEEFTDNARRDILGNTRTTQYVNPAFFMDGGFDLNIHAAWVTFGFFGRYQLDFSNRRWRQNNILVENSPKLSLSAYTVGARLGFNIEP